MGLDKTRHHGIVYNHPDIAFVQDGIDYGFDGLPVGEPDLSLEGFKDKTRSEAMKAAWAKRKNAAQPSQ
ncbi:MAG TPA: hypothetical protein VN879_15820 [Candidatus Acidoferrales bacterium]|nr:hypothetical protein [Candidatus Acidoferrales bacterium]